MARNVRNLALFLVPAIVGVAFGILAMWAAWQHNPQCSVHCAEEGISWAYWLNVGASWVVMVTPLAFLVTWAAFKIWRRFAGGA